MKWFKKTSNINTIPPVSKLGREVPAVSEYLDAFRLPDAFKQAESDTLPVIDIEGKIVGIVSEYDLSQVLPEWCFDPDSYRHNIIVGDIMTRNVWTETEYSDIDIIISKVHKMHTRVIPLVNKDGIYTGNSITRSVVIAYLTRMVKPVSLGGLATPLGVYITDGKHQAGSGNAGLLTTGLALVSIIIIVQLMTGFVFRYININRTLVYLIQFILFIFILRMTPLVKYHAAEHQTIHAIEKGLPLKPATVKMQPRAHKRCGTNIMVLLIGLQFILLFSIDFIKFGPFGQFIFLIAGFLFVFSYWRKFGMWLQNNLTTATAGNKHLQSGIKAGEEILRKNKDDKDPFPPSILQKIWNMGLVQMLSVFLLMMWIFDKFIHLL